MLLFHVMYFGIGRFSFCSYATRIFTSALVSKGQISVCNICPILKPALYKYHIIIKLVINSELSWNRSITATDLYAECVFIRITDCSWNQIHWEASPLESFYIVAHHSLGNKYDFKYQICGWGRFVMWVGQVRHVGGAGSSCGWGKFVMWVGQVRHVVGQVRHVGGAGSSCGWGRFVSRGTFPCNFIHINDCSLSKIHWETSSFGVFLLLRATFQGSNKSRISNM